MATQHHCQPIFLRQENYFTPLSPTFKSLTFFLKRLEDGIELLYKIFPAAGLDSNLYPMPTPPDCDRLLPNCLDTRIFLADILNKIKLKFIVVLLGVRLLA